MLQLLLLLLFLVHSQLTGSTKPSHFSNIYFRKSWKTRVLFFADADAVADASRLESKTELNVNAHETFPHPARRNDVAGNEAAAATASVSASAIAAAANVNANANVSGNVLRGT